MANQTLTVENADNSDDSDEDFVIPNPIWCGNPDCAYCLRLNLVPDVWKESQ